MAENRFWEITHCILHCRKVGPSSSRKNEVCAKNILVIIGQNVGQKVVNRCRIKKWLALFVPKGTNNSAVICTTVIRMTLYATG